MVFVECSEPWTKSEPIADKRIRALRVDRFLKREFPKARIALKYGTNIQLLVAVILSAQCTDKKVNEVTARLFKKYKTLDDYVSANSREFAQMIRPTGFYHAKAKNILASAKLVKEKFKTILASGYFFLRREIIFMARSFFTTYTLAHLYINKIPERTGSTN